MKSNLFCVALVALTASSAWAVPGEIRANGNTIRGDVTYSRTDKKYSVAYKRGQATVSAEFEVGACELNIDPPKNFESLVAQVTAGRGANAIAGLDRIVKEYRMLQWDVKAGRYLVEAYLAANDPEKALKAAENIIKDDKDAEWTGDLAPAYWQALMKLNKNNKLETCLKKAASSGDRAASAAALVMRGDMILNQGGATSEAYRQALTDAYLRVALMYTDDPCRAARQEAMLKGAACFEKLGMAARAESMRTQAKTL